MTVPITFKLPTISNPVGNPWFIYSVLISSISILVSCDATCDCNKATFASNAWTWACNNDTYPVSWNTCNSRPAINALNSANVVNPNRDNNVAIAKLIAASNNVLYRQIFY